MNKDEPSISDIVGGIASVAIIALIIVFFGL